MKTQFVQIGGIVPFFIDCKLGAAQAPGDDVSGSTCCCAFSLQYICDAGTDREDSFTLALHYKHTTIQ